MNITESVLISILRAFAAENEIKPNIDGVDMQSLFSLAKKHSVIGVVAHTLNTFDLYESEEQKDKFMHEFDRTLMAMLSRESSAVKLSAKLSQMDIEHILFKGMMVSEAYPISALRTYGDVDIVIRKDDVDNVLSYMTGEGYKHYVADAGVVNVFEKNKEHYEFHTNLNVSNLKDSSYFEKLWEHTVSLKDKALRFEHNFHLCYLITHLEKHVYGSGAGLRMYLDIALYIRKYRSEISLDDVREILSSLGLGNFFNTVLYVCNKWFALEIPQWVIPLEEDVYEGMCDFTLSGGVFGVISSSMAVENALRQTMVANKKNAKFKFFMGRLFPPYYELCRMYPKYSGKPYLAPVAWINHVFRFFKDKKYKHAKAIASADVISAQQKKEFLESIGSVH